MQPTFLSMHRRAGRVFPAPTALALSFASAFAPGPSARALQVHAADTVVRVAGKPVHAGIAELVQEVSVGVETGKDEYMFGDVADLAVGRDGSMYVYDRQVPVVRLYDAQGRYVRNIGRKGQGPGEYGSASGIALAPDGRLLLWDTGNWRINVYSEVGDYITQLTTPSGSSGSSVATYSRALAVDTTGVIWTRRTLFSRRSPTGGFATVWVRYRADGSAIDTVVPPLPEAMPHQLVATANGGHAISSAGVPFEPRPVSAISPFGYFVTGLPNRYAFELHEPRRPVVSIRRADAKPERVTREERNAARQRVEESLRQTDPSWSWNGPDIPDTKSYYDNLSVGDDGRVWVAVVPEVSPRIGSVNSSGPMGAGFKGQGRPRSTLTSRDEEEPHPALYDVFERDGTYLGQVRIPARVSTVARRGDQLWAVAYDENDVARIKQYRIAWK